MNITIVAQKPFKGKLLTRKFTQFGWDMLGKTDKDGLKEGWKQVNDQEVSNSLPPTGEVKVKANSIEEFEKTVEEIEKAIADKNIEAAKSLLSKALQINPKSKMLIILTAEINALSSQAPDSVAEEKIISEEEKEAFLEKLKEFTKGTIKDYFDSPEVNVKYKNTDSTEKLRIQLAEHLNYSEEKLNEAFL